MQMERGSGRDRKEVKKADREREREREGGREREREGDERRDRHWRDWTRERQA